MSIRRQRNCLGRFRSRPQHRLVFLAGSFGLYIVSAMARNRLLDRSIESPANTGTPQFWKIFYSCVNRVTTNKDFAPIQASTSPAQRITNKITLLKTLQERGVWLLDASLAALYLPGRPKTDPGISEASIQLCWDHHVRGVIEAATPGSYRCVGKGLLGCSGNASRTSAYR